MTCDLVGASRILPAERQDGVAKPISWECNGQDLLITLGAVLFTASPAS